MTDPVPQPPAGAGLGGSAATSSDVEQRYRDLFEGALLGIYVSRPDGYLVACNAAFSRMLGFSSVADAIGTSMSAVYSNAAEREEFVGRVREQGRLEHHRGRLRRRDGSMMTVIETVVGEFDSSGALVELRGFLLDVTATDEAEHALLERERQFRAVFFDASDAMLILDDQRTIVEANPAACALFGSGIAALVDQSLDAVILDEPAALAAAWRELLALGEAKREHQVRAQAGVVRIVECSYRARVHGDRHLCVARDITDRRLLEERLAQSEKIESVGRLAGGIAHDFNNLLTAILGYTELLLAQHPGEDPDRVDLGEIQRAALRAASLTQQLLAFSRKQVLLPKDVDLNQAVAALQSMLVRLIREDISLDFVLADEPAIVRIDPTQIEQVLLNLVLNARDALSGGGHIRLEVARVPHSQVDMPPELQATCSDYVRLRVSDDGVGIEPEARAHLFEPFYTTKEVGKGTGLGLASVYGIVRQSNGIIAVDSEPGRGTVFTMHFPAVTPTTNRDSPAAAEEEPAAHGRETILLVEDEDSVRVVVSAVLRQQGYNVLEAATAPQAIEIFDQHRRDVDLLLTDVVMPEMNGPALAQRLVAMRPALRILFISGYVEMSATLDVENPNVSFLAKPFQASTLASKVKKILARPEEEN
jgi:PAS domain S-box-containing protein